MKKNISFLVALSMIVSMLNFTALAADNIEKWDVSVGQDNSVTATLNKDTGEIIISGKGAVKDYVTGTQPWWTDYRSSINSVVIDEGITDIGSNVFSLCNNLTSVNISSSVVNIGSSAFYSSGLTNLTIPKNIINIGDSAFGYCASLQEVNFNAINCSTMGSSTAFAVFVGCNALSTVNIDENVKIIPNNAFSGCNSLLTVNIPANSKLTTIGQQAFNDCTSLKSIDIPINVTSVEAFAFNGCNKLHTLNFNATNCSTMGSSGNFVFVGCSSLTEIIIGENVKTIPDNAFATCRYLENISIPNNVIDIGAYAFSGCRSLQNVILPESLTSIKDSTFDGCNSLNTINIPSNVSTIGKNAFKDCNKIKEFTYLGEGLSFDVSSFGTSSSTYMGSSIKEKKVQKYLDKYENSNQNLITKLTELGYELEKIKTEEETPSEPLNPSDRTTTPDHTNILVEVETTNFCVTVPINVTVKMGATGSVYIPDTYVENKCPLGPVVITGMKVVAAPDWTLKNFSTFDFKNAKASLKYLGLDINGVSVGEDGSIITMSESLTAPIPNKGSKKIEFLAKMPAQKTALNEIGAAVIFTVDFDKI